MSPTLAGILILLSLFGLLATGMPIAFALGLSAVAAIVLEGGMIGFLAVPETLFAGIANLAYVAIPMFVLMGAAIAASLEVGKPVKGPDGRLIGTIAAIDDRGVEVRLAPGRSVMFPRDSIVGRVDGAVASISLEELEARLGIPPIR